MKDTVSQPTSSIEQRNTPFDVIEIVSRAISDCLDEEMKLLNEDIEEDGIFSGIKNFMSVELREDIVEDCRLTSRAEDGSGHKLIGLEYKNRHNNSAIADSVAGIKESGDDERSDFLMTTKRRIYDDIPNTIVFKTKNRNLVHNGEHSISQDQSSRASSRNSYCNMNTMSLDRNVERVSKNNKFLKLSRWRRGKGGLETISERQNRIC
jgi:uncharacterized Zn finger protein